MSGAQLDRFWQFCKWPAAKWLFALVALGFVYHLAYERGLASGEAGVSYWIGWQDAMTATDYGHRPYNSETNLLR